MRRLRNSSPILTENRRGKKEERRKKLQEKKKKPQDKNIMACPITYMAAIIRGH